ncbi:helix-turn-helix domain-containing protein [Paenibacillus xanthanilyticus]|uniref:Helix-turn-helix domain-containing protein n=1 Tax=Paenibacillus xanthanilyticus TaxID=1783531 RepID=A0ABV8K2N7_9BACL
MQTIYERIESLIALRGMSKKAFCEQLNISTGNFGDWKRNASAPSARKLIEIAAFFDVSLDWLMTGAEFRARPGRVSESREPYFFAPNWQLDCRLSELPEKERAFIAEYLAFSGYRRDREAQMDRRQDRTDTDDADGEPKKE